MYNSNINPRNIFVINKNNYKIADKNLLTKNCTFSFLLSIINKVPPFFSQAYLSPILLTVIILPY